MILSLATPARGVHPFPSYGMQLIPADKTSHHGEIDPRAQGNPAFALAGVDIKMNVIDQMLELSRPILEGQWDQGCDWGA